MNHEEFVQRMMGLGYSKEGAKDLIWIAPDNAEAHLAQCEFNFVPTGGGMYEIWLPGGRGGFFKASTSYGVPFTGSLGEAYNYVYADRAGT